MKEATGELNMTVITVVAIVAVGAFFTAFIWPQVKNTLNRTTYCSGAICQSCSVSGEKRVCTSCTYFDDKNSEKTLSKCIYNN